MHVHWPLSQTRFSEQAVSSQHGCSKRPHAPPPLLLLLLAPEVAVLPDVPSLPLHEAKPTAKSVNAILMLRELIIASFPFAVASRKCGSVIILNVRTGLDVIRLHPRPRFCRH